MKHNVDSDCAADSLELQTAKGRAIVDVITPDRYLLTPNLRNTSES